MTKILVVILLVLGAYQTTNAAGGAVNTKTSGVKTIRHVVEWCSPHYIDFGWSKQCELGYFKYDPIGNISYIGYDGTSFASTTPSNNTGDQSTQTNSALTNVSRADSLPLFSGGGKFRIDGEGIFNITVYLEDYAGNWTSSTVTYKIDKTAPQIYLPETDAITENTDFTYYGGRVNTGTVVYKNDSIINNSTAQIYDYKFDESIVNSITKYNGITATEKKNYNRDKLQVFYYKNKSNIQKFSLNIKGNDNYSGKLSNTYLSGIKKYEILDGNTVIFSSISNIPTSKLTNVFNSQKIYKIRVYDNTVGKAGTKGNYSETAFYVVRDNTAPNMGNGLDSTENKAIENTFTFDDNKNVYDKTTMGYDTTSKGYSRFLAANNTQVFKVNLSDTGISGTDNTLYNAGLTTSKISIDKYDSKTLKITQNINISDVYNSTSNINLDLQDSDTFNLSDNGTYRKYTSSFKTNSLTGICDLVGNCINPNLTFRVVANTISDTESQLTLALKNYGTKVIADGSEYYNLEYELKDKYGNKVVPVRSEENTTAYIKEVQTELGFTNGLYQDLKANVGDGNKLVIISDAETDNNPLLVDTAFINENTSIVKLGEGTNKPDGKYSIGLGSKVPTVDMYPYLNDDAILRFDSLKYNVIKKGNTSITYKTLGSINKTINLVGPTSNITPTSDSIFYEDSSDFGNLVINENQYGKINMSYNINEPFTDLDNRQFKLQFASPLVYGVYDYIKPIDGVVKTQKRKVFKIGNVDNYNVYEKNLVGYNTKNDEQTASNPILNFYIKNSNSTQSAKKINNGVSFTNKATDFKFNNNISTDYLSGINILGNKKDIDTRMSTVKGKTYDNTKLKIGLVSSLIYKIGTDEISLPSVAKNLTNTSPLSSKYKDQARGYFSDQYTIGGLETDANGQQALSVVDLGVVGISNTSARNYVTSNNNNSNVKVVSNIDRAKMLANIKKNVSKYSAGLSSTAGKKWCNGNTLGTINQDFINNNNNNCSIDINGEKISFIDGDITLNCGETCNIDNNRAIVVKNGSIYIKSNINTKGKSGKLFIASLEKEGLSNYSLPNPDNFVISNKKGWIFIDPKITNIDAFLFSQGPVISYNSTDKKVYTETSTLDNELRNQLYVYGSLLSLNTIGGSRQSPVECPYIYKGACSLSPDYAQIFDLIYLRRFMLVNPQSIWGSTAPDVLTPYYPTGYDIAKRAGGLTSTNTCTNTLRCISDTKISSYPLVIEKDTKWNNDPSALMLIN